MSIFYFFPSQGSPRLSSIAAPAGNNPAHESGLSTRLPAGNFPASGSDSESPGGGLPPSGAGRFRSAQPGSVGGCSAGHTGASDLSPDPDACVSGGQGHFTGALPRRVNQRTGAVTSTFLQLFCNRVGISLDRSEQRIAYCNYEVEYHRHQ